MTLYFWTTCQYIISKVISAPCCFHNPSGNKDMPGFKGTLEFIPEITSTKVFIQLSSFDIKHNFS